MSIPCDNRERKSRLREVVIGLDGSATDKAYFTDRVRMWVDERNVVIRVPKVG
ncbi:hypothetical protein MKX01_029863 [Papaver californicum]|nr:hypothetical protein MKX01_029863 [Papaver californicum]